MGAALGSLTVFSRSLRAVDVEFAFSQYHNQTPVSSLHMRLVQMWEAIYKESGDRVAGSFVATNDKLREGNGGLLSATQAGTPFAMVSWLTRF